MSAIDTTLFSCQLYDILQILSILEIIINACGMFCLLLLNPLIFLKT